MTISAWARSPHGQIVFTVFLWWMALDNVYAGVTALHRRYQELATTQAMRIGCEARGGVYGAANGSEARCYDAHRR